jgi:hypothetical protein
MIFPETVEFLCLLTGAVKMHLEIFPLQEPLCEPLREGQGGCDFKCGIHVYPW